MTEEGTGPETTNVETGESISIIGADGNFVEGWKDTLDEDIRGETCLNTVNNISTMAKQFVHAQRMIGKDKMAIPNENSPESEWDEFYKIGGRPETPGDYNITKPDDFPDELFSTDLANAAQELFYKLGLSKKQAEGLVEFNNNAALAAFTDHNNALELAQKEVVDGLRAEWGSAYDQNVLKGNIAIEQGVNGDEEFRARLTQKFGNDPDFIRFASNIGGKFGESSSPPSLDVPTPADLQSKITELMATEAYKGGPTIPKAEHDNAVAKVKRLFEEKVESLSG